VFNSSRPGSEGFDLWRIPAGGGTAVQLTSDISNEFSPSWSPDGQTVVYYWAWEGGLYTIPVAGGLPQPFTMGTGEEPAWSPGGDSIAYTAYDVGGRGSDFDIWIKPYPSGSATPLTTHSANDSDPTWSPDENTIAFISDRDGPNQLWTIPSSGGTASKLSDLEALQPAWSPDGAWIAFSSNGDISIVSPSGGAALPITSGPELDAYPSWSPSSSQIVFMRRVASDFNLWVVSLEPSGVEAESWAKIKNRYRPESGE
jgi:Tol biopolymer transport system component